MACVLIAAVRSVGLTTIEVTALPGTVEPRDHGLPFVRQKEALPDYEVTLMLKGGDKVFLGCKPDRLAMNGLDWHLPEPVSVADIATVRLSEQDKLVSDSIAEAQLIGDTLDSDGYRFRFLTQRSFEVGVKSFFGTPIGKAITTAFFVAVLLFLARFIA